MKSTRTERLRRTAFFILAAAALIGIVMFLIREPRYGGMAASEYVLQSIGPTALPKTSPTDAINAMGPALAVPALCKVINSQGSSFARWHDQAFLNSPAALKKFLAPPPDRARILSVSAQALVQFGTEAAPSVPTLLAQFQKSRSRFIAVFAAIGLSASNAIPVLLPLLHPTNALHSSVASALWKIDPTGDGVTKALSQHFDRTNLAITIRDHCLQELNSPPRSMGHSSLWALLELAGCLRSEAKETGPVIAHFLIHENERFRAKSAETLGRLKTSDVEIVHSLKPLLTDEWLFVRVAATNALRAISSAQ